MSTSNPKSLNLSDFLDPGEGPSTSPSDRSQSSHHQKLSGSTVEGPMIASSSSSSDTQLALQEANAEAKRVEENKENQKRFLKENHEIERLVAEKTEKELQKVLAPSSQVQYEPESQGSADRSNDFYSFDAGLYEKVMRFMVNVHLKTGTDLEPREAFNLVAQAGGDEKLALERYTLTNPPITPTIPGFVNSNVTPDLNRGKRRDHDRDIVPLPSGGLQWPPTAELEAVGEGEEQRMTVEDIKKSGEEIEKKRGM